MNYGTLQGLWTLALLACFVGIVIWAWSGRNKDRFERAARMPLEDEETPHVRDVPDG